MVCPVGLVVGRNLVGIAEVRIVHVATHYPVPAVHRKVQRHDAQCPRHVVVLCPRRAQRVAERVAVVPAQADPQPRCLRRQPRVRAAPRRRSPRVVIDPRRSRIVVGHLELIRTRGPIVYEVLSCEALGVQTRQELRLIPPVLHPAPQRHTHLVPRVGHDVSFALRPVHRKELVRFVVGIRVAHGHNDLARLDVELSTGKSLVEPELLDIHLAALLHLGLVFASLLGLYLHGSTITPVLKLYLRPHRPAFAEVITNIQTHVRQVEASVALVVGIILRLLVAVETLAVEIAGHHRLAVAADVQARENALFFCLHGLPCGSGHTVNLFLSLCRASQNRKGGCKHHRFHFYLFFGGAKLVQAERNQARLNC